MKSNQFGTGLLGCGLYRSRSYKKTADPLGGYWGLLGFSRIGTFAFFGFDYLLLEQLVAQCFCIGILAHHALLCLCFILADISDLSTDPLT